MSNSCWNFSVDSLDIALASSILLFLVPANSVPPTIPKPSVFVMTEPTFLPKAASPVLLLSSPPVAARAVFDLACTSAAFIMFKAVSSKPASADVRPDLMSSKVLEAFLELSAYSRAAWAAAVCATAIFLKDPLQSPVKISTAWVTPICSISPVPSTPGIKSISAPAVAAALCAISAPAC